MSPSLSSPADLTAVISRPAGILAFSRVCAIVSSPVVKPHADRAVRGHGHGPAAAFRDLSHRSSLLPAGAVAAPSGDAPGRTSRFHGALNGAANLLSGSVAGGRRPRDHNTRFGSMRRSGGRDPSGKTVPQPAANHAISRSHALPGVPVQAPSGRPGVLTCCLCPPPLRPATGRRLPAPSRRWRISTATPAACAPAPRSPASANARRGR